MASILKKIGKGLQGIGRGLGEVLGFREKKKQVFADPRAVGARPEIEQTLLERIRGRGVGLPPEVISGATAAHATQRRAGLRERTIPTISAQASARGLGRSTIPVSMIGRETAGVERDIASRVAQLSLASEELKQQNIRDAIAQLRGQTGRVQAETLGIAQAGAPTADPTKGLQLLATIFGGSKIGEKVGDVTADPTQKTDDELRRIILAAQVRTA